MFSNLCVKFLLFRILAKYFLVNLPLTTSRVKSSPGKEKFALIVSLREAPNEFMKLSHKQPHNNVKGKFRFARVIGCH